MNLADRIARLGVETAFAVSDDARAWAAKGNKVYPFHLGDMNIRTPLNIIEAAHKALLDGKTGYCPAPGIPELREVIAADLGKNRGIQFGVENVSVQPGGKPVIGKFFQALLNEGDEALYPNPGYPIYESQIQFLGGKAVPYGYTMTKDGFRLEREKMEKLVTAKTRFIVFNNGQNPLGSESDDDELHWLADFCMRHNLLVLSDEPYFHTRYSGKSKSITSIPGMMDRSVILMTFSKRYAMTGWRLGGALGPKDVITVINKLNVNQESCTPQFVQYAGIEALKGDQAGALDIIRVLRERRDVLVDALNSIKGVTVYKPEVTFYLFPDVTDVFHRLGYTDEQKFRLDTLHATGVSFCSRSHFGRPLPGEKRVYIRFAYSGIDVAQIKEGLAKLKAYWER